MVPHLEQTGFHSPNYEVVAIRVEMFTNIVAAKKQIQLTLLLIDSTSFPLLLSFA